MNRLHSWTSFRHSFACVITLVSLALLGCDVQKPFESAVTEDAEVRQSTVAHLPVSFAVGDTSLYRVLATTKRGLTFSPPVSSIEPNESTAEFGLAFQVASVDADGVILTAHVDYVATEASIGPLLFSIDTRQNLTQMTDTFAGEYEIELPGLADPNHPLNGGWQALKAITEKPFQVHLDRDGGFMALNGYAPENENADSLNLLAPGRLAMMLCLMLPPHQPESVNAGSRWSGECDGQPTSFEITQVSGNSAIYASTLNYQRDGTLYTSAVRGSMQDMLTSGEFRLGQSHRKQQDVTGVGNVVTTSTINISAQVEQLTFYPKTAP